MAAWPLTGRDGELARLVAALRAPRPRTVVIAGAAGVGKSRLAAAVAARLARSHTVLRIECTQAGSEVSMGALGPLLPGDPPEFNPGGWAMAAILDRAAGRPLVLLVDDAHWLDPPSSALVRQLSRSVTVLATLRTGERCPDAVDALWRDDDALRVDLGCFDLAETAAVVRVGLGGVVPDALVEQLYALSRGNVLFLTELATTAVSCDADQGWRLDPALVPGVRLTDLISRRIGDRAVRTVLELVALAEPLALEVLEALSDPAAVEEAEARGLIWLDAAGVRLAHPLFGEVVRAQLPKVRRRRYCAALADAVGPADLLRTALWRLEGGTATDPAPLLAACRLAWSMHDYRSALRFGRAAAGCGGGVDAAILVATVLNYTDRPQEAEAVLTEVWDRPCDERQRTELTLTRGWTVGLGLGRPGDAEDLIARTLATVTAPALRQDLITLRVQLAGARDDFGTATRLTWELLEAPATPAIRAQAHNVAAMGLGMIGRYDETIRMCQEALADLDNWLEAVPVVVIPLHVSWWLAALAKGDLPGARDAADALAARLAHRAGWNMAEDTLVLLRVQHHLLRGRARQALSLLRPVAAAHLHGSPSATGMTPHCLSVYAQACALLGDPVGAQEAIEAAERAATRPAAFRNRPWLAITRPWLAAATGHLTEAADLALRAAEISRETGYPSFETLALHTLVRLGRPARAVPRLAALAAQQDGPLAALCADHADAALHRDPTALLAVSRRFETLQFILHAAEAAAQAADAHSGHPAAAARAWALAARCEGARTPALARLRAPGLTAREHEIAGLAATGLTNKRIAAQLVISERTVENHLRAVYAKLGVRDRTGLGGLLD